MVRPPCAVACTLSVTRRTYEYVEHARVGYGADGGANRATRDVLQELVHVVDGVVVQSARTIGIGGAAQPSRGGGRT